MKQCRPRIREYPKELSVKGESQERHMYRPRRRLAGRLDASVILLLRGRQRHGSRPASPQHLQVLKLSPAGKIENILDPEQGAENAAAPWPLSIMSPRRKDGSINRFVTPRKQLEAVVLTFSAITTLEPGIENNESGCSHYLKDRSVGCVCVCVRVRIAVREQLDYKCPRYGSIFLLKLNSQPTRRC